MKKRIAVITALMLILPTVLTGCLTAEEQVAQREELSKIGKLAEKYMIDKYDRLFNVKKCEYANTDDFFITFTDSNHAYYDSDEEKFYDDRQSDAIIEDIYHELWNPMIENLGGCDGISKDTQSFGLEYTGRRGGNATRYNFFHEFYYDNIKAYANKEALSVRSGSLYIAADNANGCKKTYDYISEYLKKYFKNQNDSDLSVFVVSNEYRSSPSFKGDALDVANDGLIAELRFGKVNGITVQQYIKVEGDLYAMLCNYDSNVLENGDVRLVEVSDSDAAEEKIVANIEKNTDGIMDKIFKTSGLSRETPIYRLEFSERIADMLSGGVTIAFVMKKDNTPNYSSSNDAQSSKYGFYAYDMTEDTAYTKLLCKYDGVTEKIKINSDSDQYFWFSNK